MPQLNAIRLKGRRRATSTRAIAKEPATAAAAQPYTAAIATRKIVASEVAPTATPSIGTGKASATEAAASRTTMPASSRQPDAPEANDQIAKPRPMEAPRATGSQIGDACLELSSSRTRGRGNLRSWAGARTERGSLRLTMRWSRAGRAPGLVGLSV